MPQAVGNLRFDQFLENVGNHDGLSFDQIDWSLAEFKKLPEYDGLPWGDLVKTIPEAALVVLVMAWRAFVLSEIRTKFAGQNPRAVEILRNICVDDKNAVIAAQQVLYYQGQTMFEFDTNNESDV